MRLLARQALPLRGDRDKSDSNYIQLFNCRGEDDAKGFSSAKRSKRISIHTSGDDTPSFSWSYNF